MSVDTTKAVIETAKIVIAQVNPAMPRTYGDGLMHFSNFDTFVDHESSIHEIVVYPPSEIERKIGNHVSSLIENGATLQIGIGDIPNAVFASLNRHKRLGYILKCFQMA